MIALRRFPVALLPAVPLLGILLWWTVDDGAYLPTVWLPGGLAVLGLGLVLTLGLPRAGTRAPRATVVAVAALGAYAAWSALSVLWAQAPGVAYEGALRTVVYAAIFLVALALPWTARAVETAAAVHVLALVVVGAIALALATGVSPEESDRYFLQGRLAWPLAYQNANAALWTMAALPALLLGARRDTPLVLRPALLAGATLLLGLSLLSQSRGWLFSLPLIALAVLALSHDRLRLVLFSLPVLAGVAIAAGPALDVYAAYGLAYDPHPEALVAAMDTASARILLGVAVALALAAALVAADRRVALGAETVRRVHRAATIAAGVLVVGAVAGGLVAAGGDPLGKAESAWEQFKDNRPEETGESHFVSLGSSRYDFWRVALDAAGDHPLGGIGQDNFAETYLAERRNPNEEPRWTHSLELRLLVHTGIVGLLLFAAFLLAAGRAALRPGRPRVRAAAVVAIAPALVWSVHGSVDWLWEYPALTGMAFAWLGAAVALDRRDAAAMPSRLPGWARHVSPRMAAAVLAVAVAVPVGMAFAGQRLVDRSRQDWPADPQGALRDLDRAASLQPLSARPAITAGLIDLQMRHYERASANFSAAIEREPGDWLARFLAGIAASESGERAVASERFAQAVERNPRGAVAEKALERSRSGQRVTFAWAQASFRTRLRERFGAARVDGD